MSGIQICCQEFIRKLIFETAHFSGDGPINIDDFNIWKMNYGSTTSLAADGNGDGTVNAADYTVWRNNVGAILGSGQPTNVPEPPAAVMVLVSSILAGLAAARPRSPHLVSRGR